MKPASAISVGLAGHGLDGEEHPVVPVDVRLEIMKRQHPQRKLGQVARKKLIEFAAAVALADVPHQKSVNLGAAEDSAVLRAAASSAGVPRLTATRRPPISSSAPIQAHRSVDQGKVRVRHRAHNA